MKISVLMSVFSKENPSYFNLSMKSIWDDQTRKPDEIILVEDGPLTINLYDSINFWKSEIGSNLIIVTLIENKGLAYALNEGLKYCTGDFIARMDTDDISLPKRFEIQEKYLKENLDVDFIGGGMIEFSENDSEYIYRQMPLKYDEILKTFPKTDPFVHPSVMISRKIFDSGFQYNVGCRRNQDSELWFRIAAARYKMENVPEFIIMYRKNPLLYLKRRKSAWLEFKIFIKGIKLLYGVMSWRYVYPVFHLMFRLLPASVQLFIYKRIIVKYWKTKL